MQFLQCAMPLTTPAKRERFHWCCAVPPWTGPKRSESSENTGRAPEGRADYSLEAIGSRQSFPSREAG